MRKPNGYGSIKHLNGRRRRPFVFVVGDSGRQRPVEYFATQIEAEIFAADYNKVHRNVSLADHQLTFEELYYRWLSRHIADTDPSFSTICGYKNAFNNCSVLHSMSYIKITYSDYQHIIDDMRKSGLSYSSVKKVRSLISLMSAYADKIEAGGKNYATLLSLGRNHLVHSHHPFSSQKINRLWKALECPGVDTVLILLYTGMRIGEMLQLLKSDVNQRKQLVRITHSKTVAGIRTIPLHHRIQAIVSRRLQTPGKYLIVDQNGNPYSYNRYCIIWQRIMTLINANGHTTHDCRHTVATLLDNAGANETAKRRILGHVSDDVTERVYTHKGIRQLRKCIELLK